MVFRLYLVELSVVSLNVIYLFRDNLLAFIRRLCQVDLFGENFTNKFNV